MAWNSKAHAPNTSEATTVCCIGEVDTGRGGGADAGGGGPLVVLVASLI